MAKKPKEPVNKAHVTNSGSGSPSIFKTLFGDIPEEGIFSDANPFRRKPSDRSQPPQLQQQQEQQQRQFGLGFGSVEGLENGDIENPNFSELKRKGNKEKQPDLDSRYEALETPLEIKKSKRDETKITSSGIGSKRKDNLQKPNLGTDSKECSKRGKQKKDDLGFESKEMSVKDNGENSDLGIESKEMLKKGEGENMELDGTASSEIEENGKGKEKKNKRKRDELEAEYEAKRYGVVVAKDESGGGVVGEKRKTMDDPEDMMISKEGFDDEGKLLRTVFVGNLPLKVKKKVLLREFGQFGEVESVRIRSVPILNSKVPRKGAIMKKQINDSIDSVHAYIVFKTEESSQASLSHNMAVVGGNHIRVDRACPPRKKLKGENAPIYDNKRTVFVGNLPFDVKDEEIYQLFCGINNLESSIEAIRVVRDPGTSVGKGIAYVLFKTRDAANLVAKKRNLKLRDRELRLYPAKSNSTPSKRKNLSSADINNSPAKKLVLDSRSPDSNNKVKIKAPIFYQGLRASKSGVQKKVRSKTIEPVKLKSGTQKAQKPKERQKKRPAVAARKATMLKGGGGAASKQAGKKRKLESKTPESARRNKKARKFR